MSPHSIFLPICCLCELIGGLALQHIHVLRSCTQHLNHTHVEPSELRNICAVNESECHDA